MAFNPNNIIEIPFGTQINIKLRILYLQRALKN